MLEELREYLENPGFSVVLTHPGEGRGVRRGRAASPAAAAIAVATATAGGCSYSGLTSPPPS